MFQNITDNAGQEEYNTDLRKEKIDIKQFFTIPDIIMYVIAFMISMVRFNGEFTPFGLAIFAAMCSNKRPVGVLYIVIAIGTAISLGASGLLIYVLTSMLFIGLILIFKPKLVDTRNEKCKLGIYLFIATLLIQLSKMIFSMFLFYDLISSVMAAILTYIFYKIFVNSISVIEDYGEKKVFSIEEVIGTSILITIALTSLKNLDIFGLSITNIFSIMLVLFLGWQYGMLTGATAGITIGTILGIITMDTPILIAAYAVSRINCRFIK